MWRRSGHWQSAMEQWPTGCSVAGRLLRPATVTILSGCDVLLVWLGVPRSCSLCTCCGLVLWVACLSILSLQAHALNTWEEIQLLTTDTVGLHNILTNTVCPRASWHYESEVFSILCVWCVFLLWVNSIQRQETLAYSISYLNELEKRLVHLIFIPPSVYHLFISFTNLLALPNIGTHMLPGCSDKLG